MTKQEADAWKAETTASTHEWRVDPCHCGDREILAYLGGARGHYFSILHPEGAPSASLEVGAYEGAVPHIGEAMFRPLGRRQFASVAAAEDFMLEKGGLSVTLQYEYARDLARASVARAQSHGSAPVPRRGGRRPAAGRRGR